MHSHFSDLSRDISRDLTDVPPAQRPLPSSLADRSVRPLCFAPLASFALFASSTPTLPLAIQPDGIINTTFFDPRCPSVEWLVIRKIHKAIVGTTVVLMIAWCIHPIMVTSTCHSPEKCPLCRWQRHASYCYCTLRAARLVLQCGVCGLGKYYVGQKS